MKSNKGFSLVELIIVIAIMAVLVGILAPQYVKYVEKSRKAKDDEYAERLLGLANVVATDEDYYYDINVNDYIKFDSSGITTNNSTIMSVVLPEYISGWENIRTVSKEYEHKCYTVQFVNNAHDDKMAIKVGWN